MARTSRGLTRRGWLAASTAATALAGCERARPGEIRFWAMGREGEVAAQLLEGFEREHPALRVRVEQLPWSAAHEKLLTAYAGDATPDVAQLGNTWLPEFVALKALQPLDALVAAAAGELPRADYFDGIWATNVIDGQLWGLPWYVDTRLLFYRRDLLAQAGHRAPPQTWAQWLGMLQDLKRTVGERRYAVLLPTNEYDPLVALALQNGELLREGGRHGNFRSEAFRRTWRYYLGMFEQRLAPPASSNEIANLWNEFARGYFSFYISGPWQLGEFRRRLPAALQDAWATAPLPGPSGPGSSIAGGASLAVFRRARDPQAAWALVRYLSRADVQQRFHALTGNLPPRRSAWAEPALAGDARAQAFREQLERVRPAPQVPEWERIATELKIITERVVHGDLAADAAPAELDARTDRILEKRRWLLDRQAARGGAAS